MCSDGWSTEGEINGECLKCGCPTIDGYAPDGCNYSQEICDVCGDAPCDGSC